MQGRNDQLQKIIESIRKKSSPTIKEIIETINGSLDLTKMPFDHFQYAVHHDLAKEINSIENLAIKQFSSQDASSFEETRLDCMPRLVSGYIPLNTGQKMKASFKLDNFVNKFSLTLESIPKGHLLPTSSTEKIKSTFESFATVLRVESQHVTFKYEENKLISVENKIIIKGLPYIDVIMEKNTPFFDFSVNRETKDDPVWKVNVPITQRLNLSGGLNLAATEFDEFIQFIELSLQRCKLQELTKNIIKNPQDFPSTLMNTEISQLDLGYSFRWKQFYFNSKLKIDWRPFSDFKLDSVEANIVKGSTGVDGHVKIDFSLYDLDFEATIHKSILDDMKNGTICVSTSRLIRDLDGRSEFYRSFDKCSGLMYKSPDKMPIAADKILSLLNRIPNICIYNYIDEDMCKAIELSNLAICFKFAKFSLFSGTVRVKKDFEFGKIKIRDLGLFLYLDSDNNHKVIQMQASLNSIKLLGSYSNQNGLILQGEYNADKQGKNLASLVEDDHLSKFVDNNWKIQKARVTYVHLKELEFYIRLDGAKKELMKLNKSEISLLNIALDLTIPLCKERNFKIVFDCSIMFLGTLLRGRVAYLGPNDFTIEASFTNEVKLGDLMKNFDSSPSENSGITLSRKGSSISYSSKNNTFRINCKSSLGNMSARIFNDGTWKFEVQFESRDFESMTPEEIKTVENDYNSLAKFMPKLKEMNIRQVTFGYRSFNDTSLNLSKGIYFETQLDVKENAFFDTLSSFLDFVGLKVNRNLKLIYKSDENLGKFHVEKFIEKWEITYHGLTFMINDLIISHSEVKFLIELRIPFIHLIITGEILFNYSNSKKKNLRLRSSLKKEKPIPIFKGLKLKDLAIETQLYPDFDAAGIAFTFIIEGFEGELSSKYFPPHRFFLEMPNKLDISVSNLFKIITDNETFLSLIENTVDKIFKISPISDDEPIRINIDLSEGFEFYGVIHLLGLEFRVQAMCYLLSGIDCEAYMTKPVEYLGGLVKLRGLNEDQNGMVLKLKLKYPIFEFLIHIDACIEFFGIKAGVYLKVSTDGLEFELPVSVCSPIGEVSNATKCYITREKGFSFENTFIMHLDLTIPKWNGIGPFNLISSRFEVLIKLASGDEKFQIKTKLMGSLFGIQGEIEFEFSLDAGSLFDIGRRIADKIKELFWDVVSGVKEFFKCLVEALKEFKDGAIFLWRVLTYSDEDVEQLIQEGKYQDAFNLLIFSDYMYSQKDSKENSLSKNDETKPDSLRICPWNLLNLALEHAETNPMRTYCYMMYLYNVHLTFYAEDDLKGLKVALEYYLGLFHLCEISNCLEFGSQNLKNSQEKRKEKHKKAIEFFQRGLESDPESIECMYGMIKLSGYIDLYSDELNEIEDPRAETRRLFQLISKNILEGAPFLPKEIDRFKNFTFGYLKDKSDINRVLSSRNLSNIYSDYAFKQSSINSDDKYVLAAARDLIEYARTLDETSNELFYLFGKSNFTLEEKLRRNEEGSFEAKGDERSMIKFDRNYSNSKQIFEDYFHRAPKIFFNKHQMKYDSHLKKAELHLALINFNLKNYLEARDHFEAFTNDIKFKKYIIKGDVEGHIRLAYMYYEGHLHEPERHKGTFDDCIKCLEKSFKHFCRYFDKMKSEKVSIFYKTKILFDKKENKDIKTLLLHGENSKSIENSSENSQSIEDVFLMNHTNYYKVDEVLAEILLLEQINFGEFLTFLNAFRIFLEIEKMIFLISGCRGNSPIALLEFYYGSKDLPVESKEKILKMSNCLVARIELSILQYKNAQKNQLKDVMKQLLNQIFEEEKKFTSRIICDEYKVDGPHYLDIIGMFEQIYLELIKRKEAVLDHLKEFVLKDQNFSIVNRSLKNSQDQLKKSRNYILGNEEEILRAEDILALIS